MFGKRRPLARAAMVGAGGVAAYKIGQRRGQAAAEQQDAADSGEPQVATAPAAQAAPEGGGDADARMDALAKAKQLLDSGVLTPDEFAAEKRRILGGG